jgi:hypothetical protein
VQYAVDTHCASVRHFDSHVGLVCEHWKVPHARVVAEHPPAPSHAPRSLSMPFAHPEVPHAVDRVGNAHAVPSMPLHARAPHGVPSVAHNGRPPCGAPRTGVQTPGLPGLSHALHVSVHVELQQVPSTQWLLAHCVSTVQL